MDFDTYLEQDITIRVKSNDAVQHQLQNLLTQAFCLPIPNFDKNKSYPNWQDLVLPPYFEPYSYEEEDRQMILDDLPF